MSAEAALAGKSPGQGAEFQRGWLLGPRKACWPCTGPEHRHSNGAGYTVETHMEGRPDEKGIAAGERFQPQDTGQKALKGRRRSHANVTRPGVTMLAKIYAMLPC